SGACRSSGAASTATACSTRCRASAPRAASRPSSTSATSASSPVPAAGGFTGRRRTAPTCCASLRRSAWPESVMSEPAPALESDFPIARCARCGRDVLKHVRLAGTGRFVILPVDQGFEHGPARSFAPNPPGYDPRYHFELALAAGCNAYAAPLGFLEAGAAEFAGEIPLILKLNNSDTLSGGADPCPAITGSVDDALRLGCSAIGF